VPVRILVVTNMFPTPGRPYFGIFVERQVEALRRLGLPVAIEAVAGDRGEIDYFTGRPRVMRAIREHRPDLLHYHYGYTPLVAPFAGVPYVVTLCGDDLNGESDGRGGITLKTRAGIPVTQIFAAGARRVIVKSEAMLRRLWPMARRKAEVLPNGVDTGIFFPGDRAAARAALEIPDDALVVAFVNSIGQATKRLDLARATRDELARRGEPVHLLVAESVAPADMPTFYRAADCLLMTSDLEGSPNCVKEALACGVPVVGVPVGDLPELIGSPEMGRVVGRGATELADAVQSLGPRVEHRRSLLPPALADDRVAERLVGIYEAALASRSHGPISAR
jgi:teichuronic acid biosynthesis glycosyltransferase TuaC